MPFTQQTWSRLGRLIGARLRPLTQIGWPPPEPSPPGLRRLWSGFHRLTQISWPRDYPIAQFPNLPLILAFLGGQVAARTHGLGHSYGAAISYLALAVWAYEELAHGVNGFRRLLGLAYVISSVAHLALALHR